MSFIHLLCLKINQLEREGGRFFALDLFGSFLRQGKNEQVWDNEGVIYI